ncbi:NBS-containing resistance-like protein, partial [Trifolium medium]|nr:NBS-containing resistance-like protein [Trifolium medium]
YDVYLSFCDEDAGPFVSRLYTALSSEDGIVVFWDNDRLGSGEIPASMLNFIGHCQIAIIVFSINYANSRRCLQELEKITECCRTSDLIVLPVFYDGIYPSNGSLKSGMFGEAFHDFVDRISKEEDKFMGWVAGISKAYKYSGPRYFLVIDIYSSKGEVVLTYLYTQQPGNLSNVGLQTHSTPTLTPSVVLGPTPTIAVLNPALVPC